MNDNLPTNPTTLKSVFLLFTTLILKTCLSYSIGEFTTTSTINYSQASVFDQPNSKIYLGSLDPKKISIFDTESENLLELDYDFASGISKITIYKNKLLVSTRKGGYLFNPATATVEHTFLADIRVDLLEFFPEPGIFIYDKFEWYTTKPRPNLYKVSENDLTDVTELNGEAAGLAYYIRRIFLRKFCPYLYIAGVNPDPQLLDYSKMQLTNLKISSGGTNELRWLTQGPRVLSIIITRQYADIEYIQDIDGILLKKIETGLKTNPKYLELAPNSQIVLGTVWEYHKFFMYNLKTGTALIAPLDVENSKLEYFVTDWVNLKLYIPSDLNLRIYSNFAAQCSAYGTDLKTCITCDSRCSSCFGPEADECNICSEGKLLEDTECVASCTYKSFKKFGLENLCYPDYFPSSTPPPKPKTNPTPSEPIARSDNTPTFAPKENTEQDCKRQNLLNENGKCVKNCSELFYKENDNCKEISKIKENMGLDLSNNNSLRQCSIKNCNDCKSNYLKCMDNKNENYDSELQNIGKIVQTTLAISILVSTGLLPQLIKFLLNLLQILQKFLFVQRDMGLAEPVLIAFGEGGVAFDQLTKLIINLSENFRQDPVVERSGYSTLIFNNLGPVLLTILPMIVMALFSFIFFTNKNKKKNLKKNKICTRNVLTKNNIKDKIEKKKNNRNENFRKSLKMSFNNEKNFEDVEVKKDAKRDQVLNQKNNSKGTDTSDKLTSNFCKVFLEKILKEYKPSKLLENFSGIVFELTMSCMIHLFALPKDEEVKKEYQFSIISGLILSLILMGTIVAFLIYIWFSNAKWLIEIREKADGEDSKLFGYFCRRYLVFQMLRETAAAIFLFLLSKNYFWQVLVMSLFYLLPIFFFKIRILKSIKSSIETKVLEILQGLAFLVLILPYKFSNILFLVLLCFMLIFTVFQILYEFVSYIKNFRRVKKRKIKNNMERINKNKENEKESSLSKKKVENVNLK